MTPADWLELCAWLALWAYVAWVARRLDREVDRVTPDRLRRGRAWYRRGRS